MAVRRVIQLSLTYAPLVALWTVAVGWCALGAIYERDPILRYQTVSGSAFVTIYCMCFGWWLMSLPTSFPLGALVPVSRFVWTLGLVTLFTHIVIALGVAHGWSHAAAVEHVRRVSGFGGGIVVNYLFAAVWLADVGWWWVNPSSHANRPRWVSWAVHGFLAFVVMNATVVFGPPERRAIYGFGLALTLLWWLSARAIVGRWPNWLGKTHKPGQGPGSGEAPQPISDHSPT